MKIIYLVHQFFPEFQSGTENFVYNTARMTQKLGNKVKVITYSLNDDDWFDQDDGRILSKEYIYQGIPVLAFKYIKQPDDLGISLRSEQLEKYSRKVLSFEKPDLIHVGHTMRVHEFVHTAFTMNLPYIMTLTDFFLLCPKIILAPNDHTLCSGPQGGNTCSTLCNELEKDFISKRLNDGKKLLLNSKIVISPSKFLANIYKQEYEELNIKIVNHGILYRNIIQNEKIYSQGETITFGYAGGLSKHKGVHILIKAFTNIKNENIRLNIYGYGDNEYVKKLKTIAENDKRISFFGKYSGEQLGIIFNNIDIIITPSISYENYPFVLHEALASGVPVIASNLGGMAEKVKDGINGFTVEPGSPTDIKEKMDIIINNTQIINKLKNNIKTGTIIPTVEQEAYQYFKIYNNIVEN